MRVPGWRCSAGNADEVEIEESAGTVMGEGEYCIPMPEVNPPNVWNASRNSACETPSWNSSVRGFPEKSAENFLSKSIRS